MSSKVFGQLDSLRWKTIAYDEGVTNYQVQYSSDTINWVNLRTVLPTQKKDSNWYSYALVTPNIFYRIMSKMISNYYYTKPLYYVHSGIKDTVTITNLK